jgi:hypothetical protein
LINLLPLTVQPTTFCQVTASAGAIARLGAVLASEVTGASEAVELQPASTTDSAVSQVKL